MRSQSFFVLLISIATVIGTLELASTVSSTGSVELPQDLSPVSREARSLLQDSTQRATAESPKGANTDDDAKSPKSAGSVGGKAEGVDSDGDDEAEAPANQDIDSDDEADAPEVRDPESPKSADTDDDAKAPQSAGTVGGVGKVGGVDADGDDEAEAPSATRGTDSDDEADAPEVRDSESPKGADTDDNDAKAPKSAGMVGGIGKAEGVDTDGDDGAGAKGAAAPMIMTAAPVTNAPVAAAPTSKAPMAAASTTKAPVAAAPTTKAPVASVSSETAPQTAAAVTTVAPTSNANKMTSGLAALAAVWASFTITAAIV